MLKLLLIYSKLAEDNSGKLIKTNCTKYTKPECMVLQMSLARYNILHGVKP